MKRIQEAKQILLGPDHESNPDLAKMFKTSTSSMTFQVEDEEAVVGETCKKIPKLEAKIEILSLNEVQNIIENCENVSEENLGMLCSSILVHNLSLKQCINLLVSRFETQMLSLIVIPMLKVRWIKPIIVGLES